MESKRSTKEHAIGHLRVKSISVNFLGKNDSHANDKFLSTKYEISTIYPSFNQSQDSRPVVLPLVEKVYILDGRKFVIPEYACTWLL